MIKFELQAWSDAETKLVTTAAALSILSEGLFRDGHKTFSDATYAAELAIRDALSYMESGRFYEKRDTTWIDDE